MPKVGTYRGVAIYYDETRNRHRMRYTDLKGKVRPVYRKEKRRRKKKV